MSISIAMRSPCFMGKLNSLIAHSSALMGLLLPAGGALAQAVLTPHVNAAPPNALALAAAAAGVQQCLPELSALSALGMQGTVNNDVLLDWDRTRANAAVAFSLIGLQYANVTAAMSVTAVPEADGACTLSAERISVAPFACPGVAQQELTGYQATQLLEHMTVYTNAKDPGSSVSLIDAPPVCLVIRRYVKFMAKVKH